MRSPSPAGPALPLHAPVARPGRFVPLAMGLLLAAGTLLGSAGPVTAGSQDARLGPAAPGDISFLSQWIGLQAFDDVAPDERTIRLKPRPRPGPFRMNLFEQGDFVSQATAWWCVSASAQTMMNIMDKGRARRSTAFQKKLHAQGARMDDEEDDDRDDPWDDRPLRLRGLGLDDWAGLLNKHGYGPYEIGRARTRKAAIRMAARAMRRTGKPVGMVVWRGAHAWVMSGFTATADPAYTKRFKVREVIIQDVWFPRVSSIWGRSRRPNSVVPVGALGRDYLRYNRPGRRHPMRDGKFLLILPRLPEGTSVR